MGLSPGTLLGPYEITAQIGAGGMGEVYRATDKKLKRQVAIKILPPDVAADAGRLARFQREAEVLASLNHPHIAAIYGLEESEGVTALVMELVEGPTLADLIAGTPGGPQGPPLRTEPPRVGDRRGGSSDPPIAIDEALSIARQIAEALEAAHEQGIIHRDLKPANIKVRPDGTVKVLDFGLAKAVEPVGRVPRSGPAGSEGQAYAVSQSPTITSPAMMTGIGMILGTAAYMAPEQARGQPIDKRVDIWAFGCVLYEMLTGRRAFDGEDITVVLASVVKSEPDWEALPAALSPSASVFLRRCLNKNPKQRVGDIHDVRLALEGAFDTAAPEAPASTRSSSRGARVAWIVAGAAVVVAGALAVTVLSRERGAAALAPPEMRLQIALPSDAYGAWSSFALSPDGRALVFEAQGKLWLRPLDSETPQALPGTERGTTGPLLPFWSPDSRSVGFFAEHRLKRIDLASAVVRAVAELPGDSGLGGTWNSAGVIVFAPSGDGSPLYRVSSDGGEPVPVTRLDSGHRTHRYPQFLPDGRRFIFLARTTVGQGLYVGSLDSLESRRVLDSDGSAVFAPPDYVLFGRKGALLAQRFDLADMTPRGNPVSVSGRVAVDWRGYNTSVAGTLAISASMSGMLAYRPSAGRGQAVWLDRSGREIGRVGEAYEAGPTVQPRLSPDQRTVALARTLAGNTDVWLFETSNSLPPRRFTSDVAWDGLPVWSPDGSQIVFASNRKGVSDLYLKSVDGNDEHPLLESAHGKTPNDWSSDGRFLLYQDADPKTSDDLWALPLFGDRKPFVVVQTPFLDCCGRFSPDGHWIAYWSLETSEVEVYVQSFPSPAGRIRISTNGGLSPSWRADGRELLYQEPTGQVMSVSITTEGSTFKAGRPVALFRAAGPVLPSADGQRFLQASIAEEPSPITILLNWQTHGVIASTPDGH